MRETTLLSPGLLSNGFLLRREVAKAISGIEIAARRTPGGKTQAASKLKAFLVDASTKLDAMIDAVVPTLAAATATATSATQINIVFAEPMNQTVVPALTAFTIPGDTITAAAWTSSTNLRLTGTGFAAAEVLTYTKPAYSGLRDLAGNQVATGTKTLA